MDEILAFMAMDVGGMARDFEISDLGKPALFVLWIVILAFPLKGVDRRDYIAGAVYALFTTAAGVTLTLAIPHNPEEKFDPGMILLTVLGMMIVGAVRWNYDYKDIIPETFMPKEEEISKNGQSKQKAG